MLKKIRVRYFSVIKEKTGKESEQIETLTNSVEDLYLEISQKYNLTFDQKQLLFAINDEYVKPNHLLKNNDKFVIITPVSGG